MILEQMPLSRQVELVFSRLQEELSFLHSGIVFIQIRNNVIGKFGIRHLPMEGTDGQLKVQRGGLSETHRGTLCRLAIESLRHKNGWTHGEMVFDFLLKQNSLSASIQFESHYNMAALVPAGLRINA